MCVAPFTQATADILLKWELLEMKRMEWESLEWRRIYGKGGSIEVEREKAGWTSEMAFIFHGVASLAARTGRLTSRGLAYRFREK